SFHGDVSAETRNELAQALEGFPLDREDGGSTSSAVPVRIAVDPAEVPHAQGYTITLSGPGSGDTPGLRVAAHDDDGLHYAALTLKQLAGQAQKNRAVPACRIVDWPDFP